MPELQILNPHDQPSGKLRLIRELHGCLASDDYTSFLMTVAFAKVGPLIRLESAIENWLSHGKTIQAIWGINHKGTSQQAIAFALNYFSKTHILFAGESFTFHPKMYLFFGPHKARFYIGSHNLTVGGTETNWEGGIKLDLSLPEDRGTAEHMVAIWDSLRRLAVELADTNFPQLIASSLLLDETKAPQRPPGAGCPDGTEIDISTPPFAFPQFAAKPPSPLPASAFTMSKPRGARRATRKARVGIQNRAVKPAPKTLVIQIVPHDNGEVFLSKIAVNQHPSFFGFPFTGRTRPKFPTNPSYPQREPDPIVNITVFSPSGKPATALANLRLNTVFYQKRCEIRITVPPSIVSATPPYSVLVMRQSPANAAQDYDLEIYAPGSDQFKDYRAVCNQKLPSGGKKTRRHMGWL